ncbi:hypothetical protein AB0I77_32885 [Streptomyces sp. NPDC050619]|uniref:hypothetical protein n=1 Tax=Streptomyces sp. NPDC050619 TaxID=3157214 RepID=UPI003442A175
MAPRDGRTVDEQFTQLPKSAQRALEEVGMGLPELRRIAAEDGGERRVRHIISEFVPSSGWRDFGGDDGPAARAAVWPWMRLLLVSVAAVVVCLLSTYLIGRSALFVGWACALPVAWAMFKTRLSRGGLAARCLVGAAYMVLIWDGTYAANEWYLHLRGQETQVTYAEPSYTESHGKRVTECRVKLPDGSVRTVFKNDKWCADLIGDEATAVVDPAGHYQPVLGHKSDIGGTIDGYVCLGAGAVLVLAPVTAAVIGRVRPRRNRMGRASGTAA